MAGHGEQRNMIQRGANICFNGNRLSADFSPLRQKLETVWRQCLHFVRSTGWADLGFLQLLRRTSLQLGLYAMIVAGAIGIAIVGGDIMLLILSDRITQMASSVVFVDVPFGVETASLRPTLP